MPWTEISCMGYIHMMSLMTEKLSHESTHRTGLYSHDDRKAITWTESIHAAVYTHMMTESIHGQKTFMDRKHSWTENIHMDRKHPHGQKLHALYRLYSHDGRTESIHRLYSHDGRSSRSNFHSRCNLYPVQSNEF